MRRRSRLAVLAVLRLDIRLRGFEQRLVELLLALGATLVVAGAGGLAWTETDPPASFSCTTKFACHGPVAAANVMSPPITLPLRV